MQMADEIEEMSVAEMSAAVIYFAMEMHILW